ncbi:hypothetical protein CEP54_004305 [Fusarium duplospermum]|uniref:Heterokaryon incompatibility domain-containing protein n=1 Tax=Fusarium duplospermum TaxID=1325734 RepID=A0A428QJ44_9HYPO|nr:hypothetical protein CEP54_004305 [Fusarium duplospermum]
MQKSLIHGFTLAKDEFRLICLTEEKDLPADVIHLSLETYNDGNFPDYEAVSYTWGGEDGDGTLRHPIYIGEHWDILLQTRNCCAMLRYLRPSRGIRMVWVDAICINQEDMQERGDQVAKMGQLYTGCSQVFLWLGDDIAFRNTGVHPPRLPLHELENLEELQLPSKKERVDIRKLLERRYFNRVWIIQELILPPRIAIPIGDKIFWADPSTPTHFERLSSRDWAWEQTKAPWFQHATRGSLMQESLSELLTLTWKSQSSDIRDKVYGVMGLSSIKAGIKIRPDYGISLQHLLIGFFAHCIIIGDTPELLVKAAGVSAEAGMPSWMPLWKGDDWQELFSSYGEENPTWRKVEDWLLEEKSRMLEAGGFWQRDVYNMVRFIPRSLFKEERKLEKTVFDRRPWHQDATVDADNGAMSLNLTRLLSIKNRPTKDFTGKKGCQLEEVVEAGDDIFLLDTNVRAPIYLILRKTDNPGEFRLIAVCSQLAFLFTGSNVDSAQHWGPFPLDDLQASLYADLKRLHDLCDLLGYEYYKDYEDHGDYEYYEEFEKGVDRSFDDFRRKQFLFPGRRGRVTSRELLSLLLGIAKDDHEHKLKSWKSFQEVYLELIDPEFQPRVFNDICELSLDAQDKREIDNLVGSYAHGGIETKGWLIKGPAKDDLSRVVLRRNMSDIRLELMAMVSNSRASNDLVTLLDGLVDRLEGEDVGERIMTGPVEEDHFRGGTHLELNEVFKKFGLDGSTFRVRIV